MEPRAHAPWPGWRSAAGRGWVGEEGSGRGMVSEPRGAAPGEGGSTPPPLARLPRRCGGAGPAARRRDVTVAAAVVGAGSAAAKCELRRARAGGGVKSGSGGGEGAGPRPELVPASEPRARWVSLLAPAVCSCTALLCFCSAPAPLPSHPPPRTLSSGPNSLGTPGFPLRFGGCCRRLHPGSRARAGLR